MWHPERGEIDLIDQKSLNEVFKKNNIQKVVNLAAQAGVRYSLENPKSYIDSNLIGFFNILEFCKENKVKKS